MIEVEEIGFAEVGSLDKGAPRAGFGPLLAPPVAAPRLFAHALFSRHAVNREASDDRGVDFRLARGNGRDGSFSGAALTTRRVRHEQREQHKLYWPDAAGRRLH